MWDSERTSFTHAGIQPGAIGLRDQNNVSNGGTILNKYVSEIRWHAVRNPQLALQMYGYLDAVNTWDGWDNYNPDNLFRSGGFGVRVFLPILGMMNLNYGYNYDAFPAVPGEDLRREEVAFPVLTWAGVLILSLAFGRVLAACPVDTRFRTIDIHEKS